MLCSQFSLDQVKWIMKNRNVLLSYNCQNIHVLSFREYLVSMSHDSVSRWLVPSYGITWKS